MLKLEEGLFGQILRANGSALNQQEDLRRLTGDIADLKQRILDQITLIQELAWEAQDTASAKDALHEIQETLRDWYAHFDLLVQLPAGGAATHLNFERYLPSMTMLERVIHARQEASSPLRLYRARCGLLCARWCNRRSAHS
jgi:hypothetical protein